jgi:hypothetical protein
MTQLQSLEGVDRHGHRVPSIVVDAVELCRVCVEIYCLFSQDFAWSNRKLPHHRYGLVQNWKKDGNDRAQKVQIWLEIIFSEFFDFGFVIDKFLPMHSLHTFNYVQKVQILFGQLATLLFELC